MKIKHEPPSRRKRQDLDIVFEVPRGLEPSLSPERLFASGTRRIITPLDEPTRRRRKPSMRSMLAAAEKAGKSVTSITTPDGTTLHFGTPAPTEADNPWLADLKATKQ